MSDESPKVLTEKGSAILRRGGSDDASDDDLLVLEIIARAPGINADDCRAFFVALRLEFGEDALHALKNGHATFEKRKPQ